MHTELRVHDSKIQPESHSSAPFWILIFDIYHSIDFFFRPPLSPSLTLVLVRDWQKQVCRGTHFIPFFISLQGWTMCPLAVTDYPQTDTFCSWQDQLEIWLVIPGLGPAEQDSVGSQILLELVSMPTVWLYGLFRFCWTPVEPKKFTPIGSGLEGESKAISPFPRRPYFALNYFCHTSPSEISNTLSMLVFSRLQMAVSRHKHLCVLFAVSVM